jgi:hypothetical protein
MWTLILVMPYTKALKFQKSQDLTTKIGMEGKKKASKKEYK